MGLDSNLFTLDVAPRATTSGAVDLTDKNKNEHEGEKIHLCGSLSGMLDPSTECHHATLTVLPADKGKSTLKVIELISPPATIELKNSGVGTVNWEWSFVWEDSLYFWRRQSASILGPEKSFTLLVKPVDKKFKHDNGFPVAIFEPGKKSQTVQILHYNLDRVDPPLRDKQGQEILAIISLLSFLDPMFDTPPAATPNPLDPRTEAYLQGRDGSGDSESSVGAAAKVSPPMGASVFGFGRLVGSSKGKGRESDPPIPASQLQRPPTQGPRRPPPPPTDPNEIEVQDVAREEEYTTRALRLLEDKSLVYLTLFSSAPQLAGATIKLAEEIKRRRYKASGEELKTFVQQDKPPQPPSPPSARKSYVPPPAPSSLKIFISRMDLGLNPEPKRPEWKPDLRPPINLDGPPSTSPRQRPGAGHFPPSPYQQSVPGPYGFSSAPGGPTPYAPSAGSGAPKPVLSEAAEKERQKLLKKQQKR